MSGNLSRNFSLSEFRCPCCSVIHIDRSLLTSLQDLRNIIDRAVNVTSGYRCPSYNFKCGGADESLHLLGWAADVRTDPPMGAVEIFRSVIMVSAFRNGGIGVDPENDFVHVDVRAIKKRWGYLNGEIVPISSVISVEEGAE